jgi:hypothetical protein
MNYLKNHILFISKISKYFFCKIFKNQYFFGNILNIKKLYLILIFQLYFNLIIYLENIIILCQKNLKNIQKLFLLSLN